MSAFRTAFRQASSSWSISRRLSCRSLWALPWLRRGKDHRRKQAERQKKQQYVRPAMVMSWRVIVLRAYA